MHNKVHSQYEEKVEKMSTYSYKIFHKPLMNFRLRHDSSKRNPQRRFCDSEIYVQISGGVMGVQNKIHCIRIFQNHSIFLTFVL